MLCLGHERDHSVIFEIAPTYCILDSFVYYAAAAKFLQSCPTLCDPVDGSPPGSPAPGILQQEHWSGLPFPSPMHENEK